MFSSPFTISPHNAHYEGEYSAKEHEWRRICAADKASNLASLLGVRSVASVLEVGCGTGAVLAAVARLGVGTRHVGVDMADPTVHLDDGARTFDIQAYDGVRLPFEDASFDLVYSSHVIEHVPNPRGLLAEIRRVARGASTSRYRANCMFGRRAPPFSARWTSAISTPTRPSRSSCWSRHPVSNCWIRASSTTALTCRPSAARDSRVS